MNYEEIISAVEKMTILELNDLVKMMEEKFGVSAAPVAVAGGAAPVAAAAEAQTEFDVILTGMADAKSKVGIIKAVRGANPELGLIEAKQFVEALPKAIKEGVSKEEAEKLKETFVAVGATVEIK